MFQNPHIEGKIVGKPIACLKVRIFCLIIFGLKMVEAQDSLVNKTVYSSLPLFSNTSVPELAVDGVMYNSGYPADKQCFMTGNHTTGGETCWFAVNLDKLYRVKLVTIYLSYMSASKSSGFF